MPEIMLSDRTFSGFYLREMEGRLHNTRAHGVDGRGFNRLENTLVYEYMIDSPSVESGERRYVLPFTNHDNGAPKNDVDHYKGLLGESLMRIIITEFMRRNHDLLGIREFAFAKGNFHPDKSDTTFLRNNEYSARHLDRYNIEVLDLARNEACAEYDGVMLYNTDRGMQDGVLVCEAKTGKVSCLGSAGSHEGRSKIKARFIDPMHSLFPEKQLDVLLMATPERLYQDRKLRIPRDNIRELSSFFEDNSIGLILSEYNVSSRLMNTVAKEIVCLKRALFLQGKRVDELRGECEDSWWLRTDGFLRLMHGRRVEAVFHNTSGDEWRQVYSKGEHP